MKNKPKTSRNFIRKRNGKQYNVISFNNKNKNSNLYKKYNKKYNNINLKKILLLISITIIFIVFCISEYNLNKQADKYKARVEDAEDRYKKAQEESEYIEEYKEYINTREFKESIAREKLGLVYEDEIIFKVKE